MRRGALLLALVMLTGGCRSDEPEWTMFPAPIIMQDPRLDFARFVAPQNRTTDVDVLYATTRAPAPAGAVERYLRRPGDQVRLGLARVKLGEPGWSFADLVESSAVIAFSWPTGTNMWNYFLDCRRARAYIPDIERLIALVAERSRAKRLNLVAFSCGSPLLAEALVRLRGRHPDNDHAALQRRYRIGNALFVAADIDLATFARSHLPVLSDVAVRTQVYLSEDDWALK